MIEFSHSIQALILFDKSSPIRRLKINEPGKMEIEDATNLERYILECSKALAALTTAIEKAAFSIETIRRSHTPLEGCSYLLANQIEFAIENYYIRSGTIYDRVLIFINKLLDLGISEESISHNNIITNTHVDKYQLKNCLKKLGSVCRLNSQERNAIIHHRSYKNGEFETLSLGLVAIELSEKSGKPINLDTATLRQFQQQVLNKHTEEFEKNLNSIIKEVESILETCSTIYQIRKKFYDDLIA